MDYWEVCCSPSSVVSLLLLWHRSLCASLLWQMTDSRNSRKAGFILLTDLEADGHTMVSAGVRGRERPMLLLSLFSPLPLGGDFRLWDVPHPFCVALLSPVKLLWKRSQMHNQRCLLGHSKSGQETMKMNLSITVCFNSMCSRTMYYMSFSSLKLI